MVSMYRWSSLVAQMIKNLLEMQETQVRSLGWEDYLEKGMATHSIILAWRIPWAEEPSGLQSMESQRVGHDWVRTHTSGPKWGLIHVRTPGPAKLLSWPAHPWVSPLEFNQHENFPANKMTYEQYYMIINLAIQNGVVWYAALLWQQINSLFLKKF